MNCKFNLLVFFLICFKIGTCQQVEVQTNYSSSGDCDFIAYNYSGVPLYLLLNLADLQNTTFPGDLPFVKKLSPGFNTLFTLLSFSDTVVPSFYYEIHWFRSDPMANVNLDFPYLIPFKPGSKVCVFDVKNIDGFKGRKQLDSWTATGFYAKSGQQVFASRNGEVVEIAGAKRNELPETWYNNWTNCITLLQNDGTLICYRNVVNSRNFQTGQQVYAGEVIGKIAAGANNLELLVYHETSNKKGLFFIIPQFVVEEGRNEIVNSSTEYSVIHPYSVRSLEMTKRERKKVLDKK